MKYRVGDIVIVDNEKEVEILDLYKNYSTGEIIYIVRIDFEYVWVREEQLQLKYSLTFQEALEAAANGHIITCEIRPLSYFHIYEYILSYYKTNEPVNTSTNLIFSNWRIVSEEEKSLVEKAEK